MAGFWKCYFVGGTGGFMGADGLSAPFVFLMVGESDRQWIEPVYHDPAMRPLGSLKSLVPAGPDSPEALVDAAIAFLPKLFESCPSFNKVAAQLEGVEQLDFHRGRGVPSEWGKLREEALPKFEELAVFEAGLRLLDLSRVGQRWSCSRRSPV